MAYVIRAGDLAYGENGYEDYRNDTTSVNNVFVNGLNVVTIGDHYTTHQYSVDEDGNPLYRDCVATTGSNNVFANGKPICRNGDKTSCTSLQGKTHSDNVFIN